MKKIIIWCITWLLLLWISIISINVYVLSFSENNFYSNLNEVPKNEVWLVFWASVKNNAYPSDILSDRLKVAIEAYKTWKINQILVSGDNKQHNYNEPEVMRKYLVAHGVQNEHIHLDYAWFDTYDTLYRAKELFKTDKLTLFTQDFHLKRALYIADRLWIESVWVSTNLQIYLRDNYNNRREVLARVKAFLDVEIFASHPKFLWEDMKIYSLDELEKVRQEIQNQK